MSDLLVSWVGNADLDGAEGDKLSGPIVSILDFHPFDHVYLLHNQKDKETKAFIKKLEDKFDSTFVSIKADLASPIDFGDIYKMLDSVLASARDKLPNHQINIHLTSGTPSMTAVSILTGKTKYQVNFIQSSLQQGVQFIDIPFDIAADFLPSVPELLDKKLASLVASQPPTTAAFDSIVTQDLLMVFWSTPTGHFFREFS